MAANKSQSASANLNIHPISYWSHQICISHFRPYIFVQNMCIAVESHMFQAIQLDHFASNSNKFPIFSTLLRGRSRRSHCGVFVAAFAPVRLVCFLAHALMVTGLCECRSFVFFLASSFWYYSNEACLFVLCILLLFTLIHSHASDLINRLIDFVSFTPQNEKVPPVSVPHLRFVHLCFSLVRSSLMSLILVPRKRSKIH